MSDLYNKAFKFAQHAHGKQRRKYTHEPYWTHCLNVARILAHIGQPETIVIAALLHDVLEDCGVTREYLDHHFTPWVGELVQWCSEPVFNKPGAKRVWRKQAFREQLKRAPVEAINIKLADLIDNVPSIVENDVKFAKVYVREQRLLFDEVLKINGHFVLTTWANNILTLSEHVLKLNLYINETT